MVSKKPMNEEFERNLQSKEIQEPKVWDEHAIQVNIFHGGLTLHQAHLRYRLQEQPPSWLSRLKSKIKKQTSIKRCTEEEIQGL